MPKHQECRLLPYTQQQVFDLVADVERYPEFIDWFLAVRIRRRQGNLLEVDQRVGFKGLQARFITLARLTAPRRIDITCYDPPFKRFDQEWSFIPAGETRTIVEYETELEVNSPLLQHVILMLFDERQVARATIDAFERRAKQVYGEPVN